MEKNMNNNTVRIGIKNLKSLFNYFSKYNSKLSFQYISFKKVERQLWIIGDIASKELIHLEKIDYDEVFILDDTFSYMPETLSLSFAGLKYFIRRLEIFLDKGFNDMMIEICFEPFLDFDFRVTSFKMIDKQLEMKQELSMPVLTNLYNNIDKVKYLCKRVLKDLFETFRTNYNSIIETFPVKLVENDFRNLYIDSINKYYEKKAKSFSHDMIISEESLLDIFNTDSAILKFGLKSTAIEKIGRIRSIQHSGKLFFSFNSKNLTPKLLISGGNFEWDYKQGYIRPLQSMVKFKYCTLLEILKLVPIDDYDAYIKNDFMILESKKTYLSIAVGWHVEEDD
jgi:hypothetical protein